MMYLLRLCEAQSKKLSLHNRVWNFDPLDPMIKKECNEGCQELDPDSDPEDNYPEKLPAHSWVKVDLLSDDLIAEYLMEKEV